MPEPNNRKTIFGWCMYDWANSAYITTVVAGVLPAYFSQEVVGPIGVKIGGIPYSATTLWGFTIGLAAFLTFLFAPILGAVADFSSTKKNFLLIFAYTGSLFTILLYFCQAGDIFRTLFFFLIAQISFICGNVFYDAFLPQITTRDKMNWVSGKGYSYGYVGGGLQFGLTLGFLAGHEQLGLSQDMMARLGLAFAGLWWATFSIFPAKHLSETSSQETLPLRFRHLPFWLGCLAIGFSRTVQTARRVGSLRHLLIFLLAFMFYNDGIQTVINMATIYGKDELGLNITDLMLTLLIIQVVATMGALVFSRLASWLGTKRTIMLTLLIWSGVVIYAYFIQSASEFFGLGMVVGLALGGSQALSRSLYGSMIPPEASAEFYGFYSVFSKFSAIWGPWIFAAITMITGSSRTSILSLVAFFLIGLVLLFLVDEKKHQKAKWNDIFLSYSG